MSRGFFITGTDTGVGKTLVTVALMQAFAARQLRVAGMKPVASGSEHTAEGLRNSDALAIQRAATMPLSYETVSPYTFEPAIAPHIAAAQAGVRFDLQLLIRTYNELSSRADVILVEGAGGWRTPLDARHFLSDFAESLALDVILTVGLRLGCLNHARLTAEAIAHGGRAHLAGWIGSHIDPEYRYLDENIATLQRLIPAPCLGVIPNLKEPSAANARNYVSVEDLVIGD
jgi:dethiobiotin synthetase